MSELGLSDWGGSGPRRSLRAVAIDFGGPTELTPAPFPHPAPEGRGTSTCLSGADHSFFLLKYASQKASTRFREWP